MKTFLIFLALGLCWLIAPQQAHAAYGTPFLQCHNGSAGASTTVACTAGAAQTCASSGQLLVVLANGYGGGTSVTATISDGTNSYATAANGGTNFYHSYIFSTINTTNSCLTFTVTWSALVTVAFQDITVLANTGNVASSPLDCGVANTFTTNASTQSTTGTCTATYTDDFVVSSAVCNSANTGEFSVFTGWTQWDASFISNSYRTEYKKLSAAGSVVGTWNGSTGCTYTGGTYGVITVAAFKAADGAPGGGATQVGAFVVGP